MKKYLLLISLFFNLIINAQMPFGLLQRTGGTAAFLFAKSFNGTGNENPQRIAIDNQNNMYIMGYFTLTGSIDTCSRTSYGGIDYFIIKLDKNGNAQWMRKIGSTGDESTIGSGININLADNSLFIVGTIANNSICYIDGTTETLSAEGYYNVFLIKYGLDGSFKWAKKFRGTGASSIRNLIIDKQNNIIIIGTFKNSILFSEGDSLENVANPTYNTPFILKLNNLGNRIDKIKFSSTGAMSIYGIATYNNGYYFSGAFIGTLSFDGVNQVISDGSSTDVYLYKTDTSLNGTITGWGRRLTGSAAEDNISISCDNYGNVYIPIWFKSSNLKADSLPGILSITTASKVGGTGNNDLLWAKFNSIGTFQYMKYAGTTGDDRAERIYAFNNSLLIAGYGGAAITIDGVSLTNNGGSDALFLIYNYDKTVISLFDFGGTNTDLGETGIIDNDGNFIMIGDYKSASITIGTTTLINATTTTTDCFIAKYRFKY